MEEILKYPMFEKLQISEEKATSFPFLFLIALNFLGMELMIIFFFPVEQKCLGAFPRRCQPTRYCAMQTHLLYVEYFMKYI